MSAFGNLAAGFSFRVQVNPIPNPLTFDPFCFAVQTLRKLLRDVDDIGLSVNPRVNPIYTYI